MIDLSQIPLSDLIVAIQYQVNRHLAEYKNVIKVLTDSFPDEAHVSKVVKEFEEKIDWLADIMSALDTSITEASPQFVKEFKERHTALIETFKKEDYVTPAKPFKVRTSSKSTGKRKESKPGPNKPCLYCHVAIKPENHADHEKECRHNPKNKKPKTKPKPKKTPKKTIISGQLPSQESVWDKKHKDGIAKQEVKHARYLCDACGFSEMLKYHGKNMIDCPKCHSPKCELIAKFNGKGDRIEDFQIKEQTNALEET
jgi:hypothetical protein